MKEKIYNFFDRYRKIIFFTFGCCVMFYVLFSINNHFFWQKEKYELYNITKDCAVSLNGEKVYEGDATEFELKNLKKGDVVNLFITVPENNIMNPVVNFYNENNKIFVRLDGNHVYSYGKITDKKYINGFFNVKIPISNNCSNKELNMEITICMNNTDFDIPDLTLINAFENDKLFIAENVYSIFISIFMLIFGVISAILIFVSFNSDKRKVILMSIIFVLLAIWIFSSLRILELYTDNHVVKYYIEHISLYLAAAILALYARESIINTKYKKILFVNFCILISYTVIITVLQLLEILYYGELLRVFHAFFMVEVIEMIYFFKKEEKHNLINKIMIISFYPIAIVIAIYTVLSVIDKTIAAGFLKYVPIVVLSWLIMNYVVYFFEMSERFLFNTERKSLMSMAYIDPLTGISNRRAYEDKVRKVEKDKENDYTVVCFDINNLKIVNDKYGHKEGDRLIKTFATSANEVFGTDKDFIGRTGGDEFISILLGADDKNVKDKLKLLKDNVKNISESMKLPYEITFSSGYHIYRQSNGITFEDVIYKADKKMYDNKKKKK